MGSTNKYQYLPTSEGKKWDGLVDLWTCGCFIASTWFGLRDARLKVVVLQRTVVWVLRLRVLGAPFSRFGCFVLWSSFSSASFSKLPCF